MNLSLPAFESAHILVIGDVMLDRYWYGSTARISPEAPVPVVHVEEQEERPGGAGNVALNISALGSQVTLLGVTGADEAADTVRLLLTEKGVQCFFTRLIGVPTVTKLRVLSRNQQLIRLDFEKDFTTLDTQATHAHMKAYLNEVDVVVLSDYGKGTLADPATLIRSARAANKPILVDPKGRDFTKYQGATLLTPNLAEFEAVVGACPTQTSLVERGETLRERLGLKALLVTQSKQGMTLLRQGCPPLHLPAHAREVFDVTGAGDTVIAVLATVLALTQDLVKATTLANLAAGLVVTKLGTATVTEEELEHALHVQNDKEIRELLLLQNIIKVARAQGETIVMTNGCFDILHAGHVHYLNQAKQLGDRLIVAVNDDDSVRRLKGAERPFNPLPHRLAVLSALECVDWVIPFSEDTPAPLICQLLPDILVKGGDYQPHEIAGSDCVLAHGGRVLTLDFVPGYSTSALVEKLRPMTPKLEQ